MQRSFARKNSARRRLLLHNHHCFSARRLESSLCNSCDSWIETPSNRPKSAVDEIDKAWPIVSVAMNSPSSLIRNVAFSGVSELILSPIASRLCNHLPQSIHYLHAERFEDRLRASPVARFKCGAAPIRRRLNHENRRAVSRI